MNPSPRRLLVGALLLVGSVALGLVVAVSLFLNSSRTTVVAGHDAVVRPTLAKDAVVQTGPLLPDLRFRDVGPVGDRLGELVAEDGGAGRAGHGQVTGAHVVRGGERLGEQAGPAAPPGRGGVPDAEGGAVTERREAEVSGHGNRLTGPATSRPRQGVVFRNALRTLMCGPYFTSARLMRRRPRARGSASQTSSAVIR